MCFAAIRERQAAKMGGGLSSGGYEGGLAGLATKAMGLPSMNRKRSARLPTPPPLGITEEGAI